jgi:hypothetical protein
MQGRLRGGICREGLEVGYAGKVEGSWGKSEMLHLEVGLGNDSLERLGRLNL